jgi:hypothetical protein
MGVFSRLAALLKESTDDFEVEHKNPDLAPIDRDRIAKDLRLEENARLLGEKGLPAATATTSGPEAELAAHFETLRGDLLTWVSRRDAAISTRIAKINLSGLVEQASEAAPAFQRAASEQIAKSLPGLTLLSERATQTAQELATFRSAHRLEREAYVPSGVRKILLLVVAAVVVIVESAVNSQFFAQGLDTGLIGGAIEAFLFAGTNVVLGLCLGAALLPYARVGPAWRQIGAALLAAGTVVAMLGIAFGVGHYREALISEAPDPSAAARAAMAAGFYLFADPFKSWLLWLVTILCGAVAITEGRWWGDPFPGYERVSKDAAEARADHDEATQDLRSAITELKEEHLRAFEKATKDAHSLLATLSTVIESRRVLAQRMKARLDETDAAYGALIHRFRDANMRHRSSGDAPEAFGVTPTLVSPDLPQFDFDADARYLQAQRENVAEFARSVESIRRNIEASFTAQIKSTPIGGTGKNTGALVWQ